MELKAFMPGMILDELADAVGGYENVSMEMSDRATYGVDYFWVGRMWQDRGEVPPMPDWIVRPGATEEVSKIMKIATTTRSPCTSGAAAPALRVALCPCLAAS